MYINKEYLNISYNFNEVTPDICLVLNMSKKYHCLLNGEVLHEDKIKNILNCICVERVYNTYGPYNVKPLEQRPFISQAVKHRLNDIENCLEISQPVSPDIYQRLKQIEDRMLYLESVSPEYANFWNKNSSLFGNDFTADIQPSSSTKKQKYTVDDIDKYLFELQEQAHSKT